MAFLKFTLDAGKQCPHASGDDVARWLNDHRQVTAVFEHEPKGD
jgi:hypothetical protein